MSDEKNNWLFFGAGSPEPRYLGSRYNVGAAAVDLLASAEKAPLTDCGPIKSTIIEIGGKAVRVVKPNVVPEMIDDALDLMKKRFLYSGGAVAIFYGDRDYRPGEVKIKTQAGGNGNLVVEKFLKAFDPDVVRFRIGMGRPKKKRFEEECNDVDAEDCEKVLMGIRNALVAARILVQSGHWEARRFMDIANRGKEREWRPKT